MLNIALCDDNSLHNDIVSDLLEVYAEQHHIPLETAVFTAGADLLERVKSGGGFDIYILDMIMPELNGMELAAALRDLGDNGKVIFLTSTLEYALESYEVQAFFYLLKPVDTDKFFSVLDRAIQIIGLTGDSAASINVRTRSGEKRINLEKLLYVDIFNRALQYHLSDGTTVDGLTLRVPFHEAVAELLEDKRFVMCGARAAVNLSLIDMVGREEVSFKGGELFYPPRSAYQELMTAWQEFWNK